ncbi:molybdopterin-dependent oxidoreductase [Cellulosimicrobium cellulans]|uniref:molybdopterin-dependent oxidoreductase n=1 Tax=Cellulosimicrobium cellulans TaxID=1710 RepID=UPI002405FAD1|nr:molybdopterin-dependent oxidoreductase [Cellulosimicrobium cellulans]MDF9877093.1 DMSO/TMAO reductase YedYZ molybdopterin-dependent catalytic subunit [Cellulosimicrobium cellulans]
MRLKALRAPRSADFRSPVHDARVVARVGVLLGSAVVVLFLTGLLSHLHQHPVAWLPLGPAPSWGYRLTQGVHVGVGLACVPLLLAKLYAAYPRLFERPALRGARHALERASVAVLVAATTFQVVTGVLNVFQVYPWRFSFVRVHYAVAWVVLGSVLVHVGVKLPTIVAALRTAVDDEPEAPTVEPAAGATRRGFLAAVAATTLGVVALTVGQTVRPLAPFAVLAPRDPRVGPQGLPVNKTARSAGVEQTAADPAWRLGLSGPAGERSLSRDELVALGLVRAVVPIACVEGWSATATWDGVRVRDLAGLVGGTGREDVRVESLQEGGSYRESTLPAAYVAADDTLLALRLAGADLDLDHGFPARVVAPNRPGVLQTKWVSRIVVLPAGDAA